MLTWEGALFIASLLFIQKTTLKAGVQPQEVVNRKFHYVIASLLRDNRPRWRLGPKPLPQLSCSLSLQGEKLKRSYRLVLWRLLGITNRWVAVFYFVYNTLKSWLTLGLILIEATVIVLIGRVARKENFPHSLKWFLHENYLCCFPFVGLVDA